MMNSFEQEITNIERKLRAFDAVQEARDRIPLNWNKNEVDIPVSIPIKNNTDILLVIVTFMRDGCDWVYKQSRKLKGQDNELRKT